MSSFIHLRTGGRKFNEADEEFDSRGGCSRVYGKKIFATNRGRGAGPMNSQSTSLML